MKAIIQANSLSKKYTICQEAEGAYSTIVDSLTRGFKRLIHSLPEKSYEDFWALKEASFEIHEGDRVGIIGDNGAGKSTLLKILSRIVEPSSGSVKIEGRIASLLEVGTGFHPELSGRENIFLNGAILGMSKFEIKRRFDEIVSFSEIAKFLDTPVKYYSSGMYARLGFAIAAHLDPDILIVDEVLAVGDSKFQEKCLKKLNSVSESGKTILFVSHNSQALSALCNKGILLEKGKVAISGSLEQCLNRYMKETKQNAFFWKGEAGDDSLKINEVSLDHIRDFFYQNETTELHISCEVKKPLKEAILGIEIKNNKQETILHSFLSEPLNVGKSTLSLKIDFNMFWEGIYSLHVNYFVPNKKTLLKDDIKLRFPIFKIQADTAYADYSSFGGLHYNFPWQVRCPV